MEATLERHVLEPVVKTFFLRDRRGGPWPLPDGARPVDIPSTRGVTLRGLWLAAEKPRGAVVLAHPDRRYGKHWFVREGWTAFLHARGYDVLAFDFPGYGEGPGAATWLHEHVVSAARFARHWAGGYPVHLVGQSLGAWAAANAAPRLDFLHGLVLESPYPSLRDWYGTGLRAKAVGVLDRAFPGVAAQLRADRNLAEAHAKRILVVAAGADEVTPPRLSEAVARAGPAGRTAYLEIPGARHFEPFGMGAAYREALLRTLGGAEDAADGPAREEARHGGRQGAPGMRPLQAGEP